MSRLICAVPLVSIMLAFRYRSPWDLFCLPRPSENNVFAGNIVRNNNGKNFPYFNFDWRAHRAMRFCDIDPNETNCFRSILGGKMPPPPSFGFGLVWGGGAFVHFILVLCILSVVFFLGSQCRSCGSGVSAEDVRHVEANRTVNICLLLFLSAFFRCKRSFC